MVHIINSANTALAENIYALTKIYPHLAQIPNLPAIYNRCHDKDAIPIISGGGSGHEPAHFGYVGQGMLAAAISGPIFIPPKFEDILEVIRFMNKGKGVFLIIKNFDADIREFSKAIHIARKDGIPVKYIISHDDISIDSADFSVRHRGVAGTVLLHKIIGEAARQGASLNELESIALELATSVATLGVATSPVTIPGETVPYFDLGECEISFGVGIHGEPGYYTTTFTSSETLANELINKLKLRFKWEAGDDYILLINNLGGSSKLEELTFAHDVIKLLEIEGINLKSIHTGHFITSLDMKGLSISLCKIKQPFWIEYLQKPTNAFAWK